MNATLRKNCFLTLDLPRDNENSPLIMEQVLSAIHGAKIQASIEVWAKKDVIQFALHCKNKDRKLLKSIIENHYQGIVIRNGEDPMPNSGYYQELQLDIADIFPIRRYSQAADYVTREHTDPWNELLASLRNTKNNELQGMQFIITPYKFHRKADHTLRICKNTSHWWFFELFPPLGDDFVKLIYRSWLLRTFFLWRSYGKNIVGEKIDHRRHDRESLTESAKSKIAQISFEVCIRLVYSGDNPQQKLKDLFSGFSQFNTKKLNAFRSTKAKRFYLSALVKRSLGKVVHLCLEELAGILAFPTKQVKVTALQRAAFKVIHNPKMSTKSGILLGEKITEEQKIYLSRKDIKGHMAIVGRSGAGKSTVILKLVEDLISRDKGFCTLDPHGDLVDSIATLIPPKRITDTMLIDPTDAEYPLAFNLFATNIPKEQVLASVNDTFKKIFADFWGTRTEQVFRNALRLAVCDSKVNFLSITKILSDAEYRKKLLKLNGDPLVEMYWTKEFPTSKKLIEEHVSPLRNKLSQFLESPVLRNILGQNKNKIDFEHAIQKNKIVLIKLAKGTLGESNSSLLGNFFLHMITQAAFSQVEVEQRKSFPLFVDEMQIFSKSSDDIFRNILEEGRKYGLQLRAAFQHLEQLGRLESSIFGNIKTLVSFALGVDDSHKIAKYLEEISSADLVNLPQHFGYIRVIQDSMPVISSFKTAKPLSTQNSYAKIIQELSRLKYCRQRKNVEKEVQEYLKESLPIPSQKTSNLSCCPISMLRIVSQLFISMRKDISNRFQLLFFNFYFMNQVKILDLLSITMLTPNTLVQGGVVYSAYNIAESNKRKARRLLQQLYESKLANFKRIHYVKSGKPQKFYFITQRGLRSIGKQDTKYHEIKEGTVRHDNLTALYLTHLYRSIKPLSIEIEWYPPFPLDGKICDGAIILTKREKLIRSIIVETDRGTHAHNVMREKFRAYTSYLPHNDNLSVLFIVSSKERSLNLQATLNVFLEEANLEEYRKRILFICPQEISPDQVIM